MAETNKFKPTIGLEIHAELKTKTKMFCSCKNDTEEKRPNINICPICMGHPGTLPVINKEAVKSVIKVGVALNGNIADQSEFDRKNYFYPDIPKGYQISQYKYPLVSGGELANVKITRIHLEEDTAKSSHEKGDYSLVDFNRAGVPLMELVTEPVIHNAKDAANFAKELQLLLQYLGVGEANMEKGEMRVEANISISDTDKFGTKVEVKNLNSFRSVEKAIEYEIKRHQEIIESGGKVSQETRGWDEAKQATFSQRSKEDSHDYRYFPDPDLPKIKTSLVSDFDIETIKSNLKETPDQKRLRYKEIFSIKDADVEFFVINPSLAELFESSTEYLKDKKDIQLLSNYVVSDLASLGEKGFSVDPQMLSKLISMASKGKLSSRGVKDTLAHMVQNGGDPALIAEEKGLFQKSDKAALEKVVEDLISSNEAIAAEYKNGKLTALQFLIGQGMKATKGSANPQVLKEILEEKLS